MPRGRRRQTVAILILTAALGLNVFIGLSLRPKSQSSTTTSEDVLNDSNTTEFAERAEENRKHAFKESSDMGNTISGKTAAPEHDTFIEETIRKYPVVIFSKTYCGYSAAAKSAIASAGKDVAGFEGAHIVELDTRADGGAIQRALAARTGRSTVPNVFIGGKPVGGGDDMVRLSRQGVLPQMLRAAPDTLATSVKAVSSESTTQSGVGDSTVNTDDSDVATFGAGCFWGVELAFQRHPGVLRTEVGYSNGKMSPVSYEAVCTGRTGHAEVVRVWYNPSEVSYRGLIDLWESRHDITTKDRQGNDRGPQYRSAIFYHSDAQKEEALKWLEEVKAKKNKPVVTDVAPVSGYSAAEGYHQQYLEKRGQSAKKGATARIRCYG